jgi:hypothetical protein
MANAPNSIEPTMGFRGMMDADFAGIPHEISQD